MGDAAELEREVKELRRVVEITALLNSTLNLGELLNLIMESSTELLEAETSSLLLVDEESGDLVFEVSTGDSEEVERSRVPAGQGVAGWVAQSGEATIVHDVASDERFYKGIDESSGFETRSILAVPLRARDRVIGVVEAINKRQGSFDEHDLSLALTLSDQAAIAVENARLYAKLAEAVVTSRMSYRL